MSDFLSIFNNNLDDLFFNRPMKLNDMNPIKFIKTESGYTAIVNTLGINEEDINVSIEGNLLVVSGETNDEELKSNYTQHFKLRIDESVLSSIKSIRYGSKNGVTKIYLDIEKKESKIKIEKI